VAPLSHGISLSRYLITTADETTWKFDRPILFLGKWCMDKGRHHIWSQLDYSILDPSPINKSLSEYFKGTQELYGLLLTDFSIALNNIHSCSHSERYWNIIIGPWLRAFCNNFMFRWIYLTSALSSFDIDGSFSTIDNTLDNVHPRNFSEYRKCTTNDTWSQHIYSMIWNSINNWSESCEQVETELRNQPTAMPPTQPSSNPPNTTSRHTVLVDSYLPKKSEFTLRLLTGSTRLRIPRIEAPLKQIESATRAMLIFDGGAVNRLHQISRDLVLDQIPSVYVEGYSLLVESTSKLKLPSSPRVVFTANRHLYDDVFNAWVANATENGSSYIIGQHGGYYGSSRFQSDAEIHEDQTSDLHLTWGWKYSKKQLPGPCLTTIGKRYRPEAHAKHLLIVCDHMWKHPRSLFHQLSEDEGYLEYVTRCVTNLPMEIRDNVLIRLHHAHGETGLSQSEWWQTYAPTIEVDLGRSKMQNLLRKSRLVVTTSNGTTFLETLHPVVERNCRSR